MAVGKRIKLALRESGNSIKQLSEDSGIPVNTLYSITRRDSERVDSIILERLAKSLKLPESFLKGEPPFDNLNMLEIKKESILQMLEKEGIISLNGISSSDFPNMDFWRLYAEHIITSPIEELPADEQQRILDEIAQQEYESLRKSILKDLPDGIIEIFDSLND
ncbi:MAG: helix-turn-helix transcriptional regulator, partial [Eubacteriales bacterium]|nr:helix-turn-helix transcriptional regulator [Eubacteriales bacterium]